MTTWVIVNPRAGSGRARACGAALVREISGASLQLTDAPGHATAIAREARARGIEAVISVGGDGTTQEIVTGLCLDEGGQVAPPTTRLGLLPAGTGGDYRRTFKLSESISAAATRHGCPTPRRVDIGRAQFLNHRGETQVVAFANVLSFGIGGLTDRLVDSSPRWLGGRTAFFLGAARATLVFQPTPIALSLDDQEAIVAPFSNVAVCLGQYFGGGMKVAPDADPSDGQFDVVTMEGSRLETLTLASDIYRGTHLARSGVNHYSAKRISAKATRTGEVLIDADGQQPGQLPLEIDLLPGALELLL